jgi:hypothetical protein
MRLQEALISIAAVLTPAERRPARREEWFADLEGSHELGISGWEISAGALRYATSPRNLWALASHTSTRTRAVAGVAALAAVAIAVPGSFVIGYIVSQARGPITVVESADGPDLVLEWKNYPAVAGLTPNEVLAAPALEVALDESGALLEDLQEELSGSLSLTWRDEDSGAEVLQVADNQFGGDSMLYSVNAPRLLAEGDTLAPSAIDGLVELVATVGERHGYDDLDVDPPQPGLPPDFRAGVLRDDHGQWLAFTIGEPPAATPQSTPLITLSYGANGLLPIADRVEFEKRSAPFVGVEQPTPLPS